MSCKAVSNIASQPAHGFLGSLGYNTTKVGLLRNGPLRSIIVRYHHHHHHFICSEPNNTACDSNANEQDQQGSTSANSGP